MAATLESRNTDIGHQDSAPNGPSHSASSQQATHDGRSRSQPLQTLEEQSQRTPPRVTFAENSNKRALPVSPLGSSFPGSQGSGLDERGSTGPAESQSGKSSGQGDVDMDSDGGADDGSENESLDGESGRPSKKKKGQRFFCTDYPPCNLSFTRSEHLARHIRKHTGERPFQCHCARRFSRLDNLRQHAQTVHVNEDIPAESLAATGTRFQRQIRTDRVRPPGRARASTGGSTGSRGHGRNLSTSSITSTGSTMSTISNFSTLSRDTSIRRPQPLIMAENSPRSHLTIDTMKATSQGSYAYGNHSPADAATTPTSVAYSNTPSSPFNPALGSPLASSRAAPSWGDRTPGRRLSVPSSTNPFQPASPGYQSPNYPLSHHHHGHSRNSSTNSIIASPTSSVYSHGRQEGVSEAEWRRRTWHPTTYSNYGYQQRPATSGLMYHQTPDAPRPAFAPQPAAAVNSQSQRLPGFETFDQISQRPLTPPRPAAVPSTQPETPTRSSTYSSGEQRSMHARGHASWDLSLHQNLTKLDIANGTPPREGGAWGRQVMAEAHNPSGSGHVLQQAAQTTSAPAHPISQPAALQSTTDPHVSAAPRQQVAPTAPVAPAAPTTVQAQQPLQQQPQQSQQQPPATLPERSRRQGWYYGQFGAALRPVEKRTSSEDTSSSDSVRTPLTAVVDYQPSIVHASGYIESRTTAGPGFTTFNSSHHPHAFDSSRSALPKSHAMSGLEALVAVATSENKARDAMQCS